jgi:hypothetical protein
MMICASKALHKGPFLKRGAIASMQITRHGPSTGALEPPGTFHFRPRRSSKMAGLGEGRMTAPYGIQRVIHPEIAKKADDKPKKISVQ